MKIYDQHVHSSFSIDSHQDMEEYVMQAKLEENEYFVTTEHLDLECGWYGSDVIPDFKSIQLELKRLENKYDIKMLLGVEMGYKAETLQRSLDIVSQYPFDVILLSVHEKGNVDVGLAEFYKGRSDSDAYRDYLNLVYQAINECDNFDILGHIDFPLRYTNTQLYFEEFKDDLSKILKLLIQKGKCLELNTRLITKFDTLYYTNYLIDLYLSLGGEKMCVSSDCHRVSDFQNHFSKVQPLLKMKGINKLYFYKNRQEFTISI